VERETAMEPGSAKALERVTVVPVTEQALA
jgi:hypothetical protein